MLGWAYAHKFDLLNHELGHLASNVFFSELFGNKRQDRKRLKAASQKKISILATAHESITSFQHFLQIFCIYKV